MGTANIARRALVPAIQASGNGTLVSVASRVEERAREFAAELGVPGSHGSYEALLDADDIDAVYIPLPNDMHKGWTIRAAEAGKHVLCEKPMALSASECADMIVETENHNVVLMEAFMYRFHPRIDRTLALLGGGAIGALRSMHSSFTFRLTPPTNIRLEPEHGGGALMDVGCYCVNVSRTFAGAEPVEVQAFANWGETGVDTELAGTLRFADGMLAQFDCSLTQERREVLRAAGPDGHIEFSSAFLPGVDDATIEIHRGRSEREVHTIDGVDEYRLMVEHFGDCVLKGGTLRYPPTEAQANMRAIEALYRSARNGGRPEPLRV